MSISPRKWKPRFLPEVKVLIDWTANLFPNFILASLGHFEELQLKLEGDLFDFIQIANKSTLWILSTLNVISLRVIFVQSLCNNLLQFWKCSVGFLNIVERFKTRTLFYAFEVMTSRKTQYISPRWRTWEKIESCRVGNSISSVQTF